MIEQPKAVWGEWWPAGEHEDRPQGKPPEHARLAIPAERSIVLAMNDAAQRVQLAVELAALRWSVRQCASAVALLALLEQEPAAIVILDPWLPDLAIQECMAWLVEAHPEVELLASDGSDLRGGLVRGRHRAELLHTLRAASAIGSGSDAAAGEPTGAYPVIHPQTPLASQKREHARESEPDLPEFLGDSEELTELRRRIRLVARRRTPVLVVGPTGTGKELAARALHRLSDRAAGPFVAINCAAIPEALVESELFGHARGAFTGAQHGRSGRIEAAAGGTLFLDEIGELPLAAQSKLLRFLESGEMQRVGENTPVHVDTRVVAATHRRLGAMAAEGSFRLDLLHRLSVFLLRTPALAGRHADIDRLLAHRLHALAQGEPEKTLGAEARAQLHAHTWPGNVRELEHTLERAWILAGESSVIDVDAIEFTDALD